MSAFQFNDLFNQLNKCGLAKEQIGVSFRGRGLKLDTEKDCHEVITEIDGKPDMKYLDLEGNTLGVEAAEAIGKALENKKHLSSALWKDMFTGRMKTEIPKALRFITSGLGIAGAMLTELDLSDNAFGPIGVEALADFLQSPVCYGLQELRLNNNGLGVTGGKILANALMKAHENSSAAGKPLALKIFIAGRNRLENPGATALAKVFKVLGSLEEITMPQNGIYHKGISKLSEALMNNKNLRLLNLNDNTLTAKGAASLAAALPSLQKLQILNLGDCLLKTKGAVIIAEALSEKHGDLEELILDSNEIRTDGGVALIRALKNKRNLKKLCLLGNEFGEDGRSRVKNEARSVNLDEILDCPSDDDGEASEGDEDAEESGSEDEDTADENSENDEPDDPILAPSQEPSKPLTLSNDSAVNSFLNNPSVENFTILEGNDFGRVIKSLETIQQVPVFIQLIMKVSNISNKDSRAYALKLYKVLFNWAESKDVLSTVNNELFVHLQLIKGEDDEFKINWDADCCVRVLEDAVAENIVPDFTQHILTCCLERKSKKPEEITIS